MAAQKQILESIRDIIGGSNADEEEILDLTDVVEPAKDEVKGEPLDLFKEDLVAEKADAPITNDVLREIDALLADDEIKEEIKKPITAEGTEIELADFIGPDAVEQAIVPKETIPEEKPVAAKPVTRESTQGEIKMEKEETLVSNISAEEARNSLKTLMAAAENISRPKVQTAPFRNGDTVEDLVMDMLKPILKEWLDTNLPSLVQSIVEKEIKKLVPKE